MENIELKNLKLVYEKMRDERDNQVNLINNQIQKLQEQKGDLYRKDFVKEIYDKFKIEEKGVSLQDFRKGINSTKF